jgi:hypothetical protein
MSFTSALKPFVIQAIIFRNLNAFIALNYIIVFFLCKLSILLSDNILSRVVGIDILSLFDLLNNAKLVSRICVFLYFLVTFFFNEYCTMGTAISIQAVQLLRLQCLDLAYPIFCLDIYLILWIFKFISLIDSIDAADFIINS